MPTGPHPDFRHDRSPFTLAAATLALALAAAGSAAAQPIKKVPEQGFLCCNMRTDGAWISDSNYAEGNKTLIAAGTPVTFAGYGRNRVYVRIDGRSQAIGNDYSRDLSLEDFAARYIWPSNPRDLFAGADPRIRAAAESARVTRGMTRQQVLVALGFPISSETPHLDARVWKYWLWSFSPFTVHFDGQGYLTHVRTDPATMSKVYME